MNTRSFDAFVQSLTTGTSRRGFLAIVTAGLVAPFIDPSGNPETSAGRRRRKKKNNKRGRNAQPPSPPAPISCPSGQRLCPEGICLPGDQCCLQEKACGGVCIPVEECCTEGERDCPTGQTCCPSPRIGLCVDLQNDPLNCGICTLICPTGNTCEAGECQAP
jgi:hypothetical protein